MSSVVGIHLCLMRFIALKGQDAKNVGRKQRNRAGTTAVNNAGGQLPGFMVGDPAPIPPATITTRFLFLPAVYCSLHLSHREPHLLKEMRQNNETIGCGL